MTSSAILTGNRLLEGMAHAVQKACRSGGFRARHGGDESFCMPQRICARRGRALESVSVRDMVRAVGRERRFVVRTFSDAARVRVHLKDGL